MENNAAVYDQFHFEPVSQFEVTESQIKKAIEKLINSLSKGPDSIPVTFVETFVDQIVFPLSMSYNRSISSGTFSLLWKTSYVTLVSIKDDKQNVKTFDRL